jgi:hypothetical protein
MIAFTRFTASSTLANMQSYRILVFLPQSLTYSWEVRPVGRENIAGRSALVVDWYDAHDIRKGRWWVDARLGVILAQRTYAQSGSDTDRQPVLEDRIILSIQTGMAIPALVLNAGNDLAAFASDATGTPLEKFEIIPSPKLAYGPSPAAGDIEYQPPPVGFDPNQSFLTLRPKPLPGDDPFEPVTPLPADSEARQGLRSIDVFGDGYFLGTFTLPMPGSWRFSSCSRSPDGSLVVFDLAGTIPSLNLDWFRLSKPDEIHTLPQTWTSYSGPGYDAWSPSSQELAFYGCSYEGSIACGIALLDFNTSLPTRSVNLDNEGVRWLGWSPDGKSLAAVIETYAGSAFSSPEGHLKVYQVSSGELTYSGPFNLQTFQAAPDAPTRAWGEGNQPEFYTEKGCATP